MPYIYQCKKWPHFFWNDEALASLLAKVHYHQGKLCGQMSTIGFSLREETLVETLTQDVAKSSEIEGELLDLSQVRSSVARHLGLEVAGLPLVDRHIDGIVEMVLDATQKYDAPLTEDRMLGWHSALFPTGRSHLKKIRVGEWRTQVMQIVSGPMSKEQIHYEAPPPEIVDEY
ncbi:MAG: DUF4172 domain-containing protein, partial [Parachlamydiaceae bacterium]